jgi:hypothetical protein
MMMHGRNSIKSFLMLLQIRLTSSYEIYAHVLFNLMGSLGFFIDLILLAALLPWESTEPLTEMSTTELLCGVKAAGT